MNKLNTFQKTEKLFAFSSIFKIAIIYLQNFHQQVISGVFQWNADELYKSGGQRLLCICFKGTIIYILIYVCIFEAIHIYIYIYKPIHIYKCIFVYKIVYTNTKQTWSTWTDYHISVSLEYAKNFILIKTWPGNT